LDRLPAPTIRADALRLWLKDKAALALRGLAVCFTASQIECFGCSLPGTRLVPEISHCAGVGFDWNQRPRRKKYHDADN
jgi:hypothetical protein